jgi:hypothetical protein
LGTDTNVYFVVNIDSDPDPENTPPDDDAVMEKYRIMKQIVDERVDGKGTICVQTSPMYRDRFFESHFLTFWRTWVRDGGDLTLHPEEDLYSTPETRFPNGSYYGDAAHMDAVIRPKAELMKAEGLSFAAYKGGYHGLTMDIVRILETVGIPIDMTCAPGIDWLEKLAAWGDAPTSAYYMSSETCGEAAAPGTSSPVFEIPFGWDGESSDTSRRLLNRHYLVNEFSNYQDLCRVWDRIVERAETLGEPQIVSFLCHTYAMQDDKLRRQLSDILSHMVREGGIPVTATQAKNIYDNSR